MNDGKAKELKPWLYPGASKTLLILKGLVWIDRFVMQTGIRLADRF
jgi:hypothetical protein